MCTKDISINYIVHNKWRRAFSPIMAHFLCKIKDENKERISFTIHTSYDYNYWETFAYNLVDEGIDSSVILYTDTLNYMQKIKEASEIDLGYSISLDEDVILGNHAWDNFIDGVYLLKYTNNLLVTPLISVEVGSVGTFITELCGYGLDLIEFHDIYKKTDFTEIGNKWGVDYSSLNECVSSMEGWSDSEFYYFVEKINHYYKGIHPIRISIEAQRKMVKTILKYYDSFVKKRNLTPIIHNRPYFTNHVYAIRTDVWRNILKDNSLFRDAFDEVPLNLFRRKTNTNIILLLGALGLHGTYTGIGGDNQMEIEDLLLRGLYEKINSP